MLGCNTKTPIFGVGGDDLKIAYIALFFKKKSKIK